jgi:hypothetical protein
MNDNIDHALRGMKEMGLIAPVQAMELNEGKFELSEPDGNRLAFAVGDLLDRLDKLMGDLDKGGAG